MFFLRDFNAQHQSSEPNLPPHHRNTAVTALFQAVLNSPQPTSTCHQIPPTHPHPFRISLLETLPFTEQPFHWTVHGDRPPTCSRYHPSRTPKTPSGMPTRWKVRPTEWPRYQDALQTLTETYTLPLEDAADALQHAKEAAGASTFHRATRITHRRQGKHWWTDKCAKTVKARRSVWSIWKSTPTPAAGRKFRRLDAMCKKTIFKAQRNSWNSHCFSLSFPLHQ